MNRDISAVQTDQTVHCVHVINDKTIEVYTDQSVTNYTLVTDKYIASKTAPASTPKDDIVCHTMTDLEQMPSQFDFIAPIYEVIAIGGVLAMFYLAYRILIYPFFKRV